MVWPVKIDKGQSITVSPGRRALAAFQNIKPGDTVTARIVSIKGPSEAMIKIAGREFKASFLKGVPGSSTLLLRLDERAMGSFRFTMVDPTSMDGFLSQLSSYRVGQGDIQVDLFQLHQFIRSGKFSLFELNRILMGRDIYNADDRLMSFLEKLYPIHQEGVTNLVMLLNKNNWFVNFFYTFFRQGSISKGGVSVPSRNQPGKDLFRLVDSLDDDEKKDFIQLFASAFRDSGSYSVVFSDDGKPFALPVLEDGSSFMVLMEYDHLGTIEALFRMVDNTVNVAFFIDDEAGVEALNQSSDELVLAGKTLGVELYPVFYLRKNIVDKIIQISHYYSFNSAFDRKV